MRIRDAFTPLIATALFLFLAGSVVDIFICLSASWAYAETDHNYTHIGLFRTCNGKQRNPKKLECSFKKDVFKVRVVTV